MTVRLVIPYDTDTLEAGEWDVYDVEFCQACGEDRPVVTFPDWYRCLACFTVRDFTEASC